MNHWDVTVVGGPQALKWAVILARRGYAVCLLAAVPADEGGEETLSTLAREGVDASRVSRGAALAVRDLREGAVTLRNAAIVLCCRDADPAVLREVIRLSKRWQKRVALEPSEPPPQEWIDLFPERPVTALES